jgi:hypothetical protein
MRTGLDGNCWAAAGLAAREAAAVKPSALVKDLRVTLIAFLLARACAALLVVLP